MLRNGLLIRVGLLVVLGLLTSQTSCARSNVPSGPVIKVDPPVSSIQVNDTVRVPIKVENIANLTALEVHLSFDPTVLEVTELVGGGFVKADFSVQNTFDNAAGTIDYAIAQLNRAPVNGSGTLLEIVFHAKSSGDSPVHFRGTQAAPTGVLLADSNGMAIQVSLTEGNLSIK